MKYILIFFLIIINLNANCFKSIKKLGYKEKLLVDYNIVKVNCKTKDSDIQIKNRYTKYIVNKNHPINKKNTLIIRPSKVILKLSDTIFFEIPGKLVEETIKYVKIKKQNKEIIKINYKD